MLGEEFGVTGGGSRRWIVDPIDGTRNYSRGIPVWATLIALEEDGVDPARRRLGPRARPALVGRAGSGRVRQRRSDPRLPGRPRSRTPSSASRSSGRCRRSRTAAGTRARTATSGRTCSSPRVPSTARSTRSASRSGISPRCSRSSRRPAGASAIRTAPRASTASRRSRRTGSCTRRCWRRDS